MPQTSKVFLRVFDLSCSPLSLSGSILFLLLSLFLSPSHFLILCFIYYLFPCAYSCFPSLSFYLCNLVAMAKRLSI